ncbi:MAG: 50S ribosomal protein L6 [Gammaproteobacteria bacterium]
MSRVSNNPVYLPSGIKVSLDGQMIKIEGSKGSLEHNVHDLVKIIQEDESLKFSVNNSSKEANALAGTTRAVVQNMVTGVSDGFVKKLEINGVGYRAQVQGKVLNLTLGLSHPVNYEIPEGISIEAPSQTEIIVKGIDKQQVGQVSAEIRAYRRPEPYKGKGIKYADEVIIRKEAKKA